MSTRSRARPPRVFILIRSLQPDGAERQTSLLATGLRRAGWEVSVACFYGGGPLEDGLRRAGVTLIDLRKAGRWNNLTFLWRLARQVRQTRPDVLYSVLDVANLVATVVRPLSRRTRLVWGVRASAVDRDSYDPLQQLTRPAQRRLSRFADAVICNSAAGRDFVVRDGWRPGELVVVPNGVDTGVLEVAGGTGERVRAEWGVAGEALLFTLVGRGHPVKGHPDFLEAAAVVARQVPQSRFACVGVGAGDRPDLARRARELGLDGKVVWAGHRSDMAAVYAAADVVVSASLSEGMSNAITEAMAAGRPCVVTDVGDSRALVGDTGLVVPARDPLALAAAMTSLAQAGPQRREELGARAQERIRSGYSVEAMVRAMAHHLLRSGKAS